MIQIAAGLGEIIKSVKNDNELDSKKTDRAIKKAIGDTLKVFTDHPLLTGVRDIVDAASGDQRSSVGRYLGQFAGSFVPNILSRTTKAIDPTIYEKRDFISQVKSKIPGMQGDLVPKRTIFGEPLEYQGSS